MRVCKHAWEVSGLHNCFEFSQPSSCLDEAICKQEKVLKYLNCGERWENMIDHRSYTHNLRSCEIKIRV